MRPRYHQLVQNNGKYGVQGPSNFLELGPVDEFRSFSVEALSHRLQGLHTPDTRLRPVLPQDQLPQEEELSRQSSQPTQAVWFRSPSA